MRASTYGRWPTARAEYSLPRRDSSVRWARRLTSAFLAHPVDPALTGDQLLQDATLVVSELVTNATRHGDGDCRLRLYAAAGLLIVEVHDSNPSRPRMGPMPGLTESGRGIAMVRHVARSFSVTSDRGGGKTVRAVLGPS
ncbi:ATP-binding protein [Streptomyces sp. NPDC054796]